jgi:hypothetical protein
VYAPERLYFLNRSSLALQPNCPYCAVGCSFPSLEQRRNLWSESDRSHKHRQEETRKLLRTLGSVLPKSAAAVHVAHLTRDYIASRKGRADPARIGDPPSANLSGSVSGTKGSTHRCPAAFGGGDSAMNKKHDKLTSHTLKDALGKMTTPENTQKERNASHIEGTPLEDIAEIESEVRRPARSSRSKNETPI